MKILLIGGTGFIGAPLVRQLMQAGHHVTVFSRGMRDAAHGVDQIAGDRRHLAKSAAELRSSKPDVVVDLILSSGRQATELIRAFRGVAPRVVALSSGDVYRACGILHGIESGPLQEIPLTEASELRTNPQVYSPETLERVRAFYPWLDDQYDKISVERTIMSDAEIAGTVLRLPMIYGPGDPAHRLFPYIKRMDDRRPAILIQEDAAQWIAPRGYVENVAAAIALATVSQQAAGRIYNVAETEPISELEWVRRVGRAVGWNGSVIPVPKEITPPHLQMPYRCEQHWFMSSERIREELGFSEPVAQAQALECTIAWERSSASENWNAEQFDYAAEDKAIEDLGAQRAYQ